jgi:hypothetical protein
MLRRPLLVFLTLGITLAGCYAPAAAPGASPGSVAGSGGSATTSTSVPSSVPEPTSTYEPTSEPTPEPTPEPTARPTPKPTPRPTTAPLPWRDSGSVDTPYEIHAGTKIRFRLWDFSAPATCSLKFTWPDSSVLKLATKTATKVGAPTGSSNPYGIDWYLNIPSTQVGDGRFDYVCKYLGITRLDSWWTITIQPPS